MKTPEEMAKEWAKQEVPQYYDIDCTPMDRYAHKKAERGFLAGYKAAKQWISVKDRLPQLEYGFAMRRESECVLIASDGNVHVAHLCEKWCDRTQLIFEACDCDCRGHDMEQDEWELDQVTHWMELPKAPKEEK